MNHDDLHGLLDRATDAIETPALVAPALRTARLRRTRRRGAAAALLVSGLVTTVVVATHLGGSAGVVPPTAPSETPSTEVTDPPREVEQPRWDPREVDDLPAAPDDVAPALPDTIDPPATSPALADDPIDAAVAAVQSGSTAQLLSTDGSWRSVPLPGRFPRLALSPDGSRLAVTDDDLQVVLHDLAAGTSRAVSTPEGFQPWDFSQWRWADAQTLLLDDLRGGWRVDADTGAAEEVPYPSAFTWTIDPAGDVVQSADVGQPALLTDWAGGRAREVALDRTLERMSADENTVVGTTWGEAPFSVSLADRRTATPRAVLPVLNPDDNYGKGGLSVLALADDGTVLMRVSAIDGREVDGFRVVAWEPDSGSLSLVASARVAIEDTVVFADGLIRKVPAAEPVEGVTGAPPIDPAVVQPMWDPDDVASLPRDSAALPEQLTVPDDLPPFAGRVASAMVLVAQGDRIAVLGSDGSWGAVEYPEGSLAYSAAPVLSADGITLAFAGATGVWWQFLGTGDWQQVPYPSGFDDSGDACCHQVGLPDPSMLTLSQRDVWWAVDPRDPSAQFQQLPFSVAGAAPDELLLELRRTDLTKPLLVEWRDGTEERVDDVSQIGFLRGLVADDDSLAATVFPVEGATRPRSATVPGLVALDRRDLTTRALLPYPRSYAENGGITPLGWMNDDTVLVAVRPERDPTSLRVVAWNVRSGRLALVASAPGVYLEDLSFSVDPLADP